LLGWVDPTELEAETEEDVDADLTEETEA
jgi:hypothetical protein